MLVADRMFVSGMPFFITLSQMVRYVTVQLVPRQTVVELASSLKLVIALYRRAGFICQMALVDGEFKNVKEKLVNIIEVNFIARNKHVLEIKRKIRQVREQTQFIKVDLLYRLMPAVMIKKMVLHAVMFMNAHVDKQGISNEYLPRELIPRW